MDAIYNSRLENVISGVNTYWLSQPLQNSYGLRQYLDAEGGDTTFRYDVYGSFQTNPGVMIGSSRDNYSGGMTFYYNPTKKLLFRNDLQILQNNATDSPYGSFSSYVAMNPYYPLTDANGNFIRELANYELVTHIAGTGDQFTQDNVLNPLYEAHVGNFSKSAYLNLVDNLSVDWHLAPSLRLQAAISLTDLKATSDVFVSPTSDQFYYGPANQIQNRGSYTYTNDDVVQYDGRLQLNYNKLFGYHSVNLALVSEIYDNTDDSKNFEAVGFSNATFTNIGFARTYLPNAAPNGDVATTRKLSNILIGNYAFKDKYLLDATFNYSGSSVFGDNKKLFLYGLPA